MADAPVSRRQVLRQALGWATLALVGTGAAPARAGAVSGTPGLATAASLEEAVLIPLQPWRPPLRPSPETVVTAWLRELAQVEQVCPGVRAALAEALLRAARAGARPDPPEAGLHEAWAHHAWMLATPGRTRDTEGRQ